MTLQVIEVYRHVLSTPGSYTGLDVNVPGCFRGNSRHSFYMPVYATGAAFPNFRPSLKAARQNHKRFWEVDVTGSSLESYKEGCFTAVKGDGTAPYV